MATLTVRPIGIRDLTSFRTLQRLPLCLGYGGVPVSQTSAGVLASLPLTRRYWRGYIASVDGEVCAAVELQPEPRDFRWVVATLAARALPGADAPELLVPVWEQLLLAAIRAAGADGARRLHACPPIDGPAIEAFQGAHFITYAYQTTLLAQRLRPAPPGGLRVREQEPSDAWAIHQLYHQATPPPIQYAEAFTSNHWDAGRRAAPRVRGFLLERDHQVVAYCRVTARGHRHVVEVLTLPGQAALLRELVPQALSRAGVGADDEIWVGVPDYHGEYVAHLEAIGFTVVGRQARMVRHTVGMARSRLALALHLGPDMGERLSVRLPSYTSVTPQADRVSSASSL
ncbi:MAG: hypothetical protein QJR03_11200 [Sphaerobacter sp.]|nr:hypothetical protein [Sphaerobacter sp.]